MDFNVSTSRDVIKHKIISKPHEKVKTEIITSASKRSLKYPALESIVDFDFNAPTYTKRMKKSGPAYVVMRILQRFREEEKRDPLPESRDSDIKKLLAFRDEMSSVESIPDVYFEHVFAQISPCAAMVGGAIGQEVIKAVSQTEAPHYNYFFFDPQTSCGFIQAIE